MDADKRRLLLRPLTSGSNAVPQFGPPLIDTGGSVEGSVPANPLSRVTSAGPGAADRPAADRDVPRPPETDPVRELHRGSVHARAPAGPGLHPEDRGIQPSDPVSAAAVRFWRQPAAPKPTSGGV